MTGREYGLYVMTANKTATVASGAVLNGNFNFTLQITAGTLDYSAFNFMGDTPVAGGTYEFSVVQRTPSTKPIMFCTMAVAAGGTPPVFSAQSAPGGTVGIAYSYQFVATGSPTYALATGSLPAGLGLSSGGLLSGTPTTAATSGFTINGTNGSGTTTSSAQSVVIGAAATVPGAPTIGTATAGNTSASVAFTAPASNGGSAITGYTATSTPGGLTGTGASSPITVTGLTNGTAYTFKVKATNAVGTGADSAASNSVTPASGGASLTRALGTVPGSTVLTATDGSNNWIYLSDSTSVPLTLWASKASPTLGAITPSESNMSVIYTSTVAGFPGLTSDGSDRDGGGAFTANPNCRFGGGGTPGTPSYFQFVVPVTTATRVIDLYFVAGTAGADTVTITATLADSSAAMSPYTATQSSNGQRLTITCNAGSTTTLTIRVSNSNVVGDGSIAAGFLLVH